MLSRRDILRAGSGAAIAMLTPWNALAQVRFGTELPRFVDPLRLPPTALPGPDGGVRMSMRPGLQQVHSALAPTPMWGYDAGGGPSWPGPTIQAVRDTPLRLEQTNALGGRHLFHDSLDHHLPHHGCPELDGRQLTHEHADLPRTSTHLHGARVAPTDDGFPDLWSVAGETAVYRYPNRQHPQSQRAATLWYHDHAMGITRLNVYAGLAGFYLIRDPLEAELGLPVGEPYELPLLLQDRDFHEDGTLAYPAAPWVGNVQGVVAVVNGTAWPRHAVDRGGLPVAAAQRLPAPALPPGAGGPDVHGHRHGRRTAAQAGARCPRAAARTGGAHGRPGGLLRGAAGHRRAAAQRRSTGPDVPAAG